MSIATLILGESGRGKSYSLRNLNPETTLILQTHRKPLPFRANGLKPFKVDSWQKLIDYIKNAKSNGKDVVIIDDFQYLMANEFMRRSSEKGFDKFTEIGHNAWAVMKAASEAADDVRVYLLNHTENDGNGGIKAKTIGKMLDEKITVEGMFTIVLRSMIVDGKYKFATQNNGQDTTKSPVDMFADILIENDLAAVDAAICDYYGITPLKGEQKQ